MLHNFGILNALSSESISITDLFLLNFSRVFNDISPKLYH